MARLATIAALVFSLWLPADRVGATPSYTLVTLTSLDPFDVTIDERSGLVSFPGVSSLETQIGTAQDLEVSTSATPAGPGSETLVYDLYDPLGGTLFPDLGAIQLIRLELDDIWWTDMPLTAPLLGPLTVTATFALAPDEVLIEGFNLTTTISGTGTQADPFGLQFDIDPSALGSEVGDATDLHVSFLVTHPVPEASVLGLLSLALGMLGIDRIKRRA